MYIIFLSRILSIIPLLIYKRLSKNKKKEPKAKTNENDIQYIYNIYIMIKKDIYLMVLKSSFKVAIFEFLAESLIFIFYFINDINLKLV